MVEGIGPPMEFEITEYEGFREDLKILGWTVRDFSARLGRTEGWVYHWKRIGVPQYARAYVDLAFELMGK